MRRLKLSRTVWVALAIGVFLVLFFTMGMAYRGQTEEQSQLNDQIAAAQQKIAKFPIVQLSSKEGELNKQLAEVESQIISVKTELTQSTDGIDGTRGLFELADAARVELLEVRSSGVNNQTISEVPFRIQSLTVKVKGSVLSLIYFILNISEKFPTGVVKSLDLSNPPAAGDGYPASSTSATIILNIYSYGGR